MRRKSSAHFDFEPGFEIIGAELACVEVAQEALDLVRGQDFAYDVEHRVVIEGVTNLLEFFHQLLEHAAFNGVLREEIEDQAVLGLAVAMDAAHALLQPVRFHGMS